LISWATPPGVSRLPTAVGNIGACVVDENVEPSERSADGFGDGEDGVGIADAGAGTRHPGNLSLKAFHALASCRPERAAPRSLRWIFGS
jgi:hypothetical protein